MRDGSYTYLSEHWVVCWIVKSICRVPKTNVTLYVNSTPIKKKSLSHTFSYVKSRNLQCKVMWIMTFFWFFFCWKGLLCNNFIQKGVSLMSICLAIKFLKRYTHNLKQTIGQEDYTKRHLSLMFQKCYSLESYRKKFKI